MLAPGRVWLGLQYKRNTQMQFAWTWQDNTGTLPSWAPAAVLASNAAGNCTVLNTATWALEVVQCSTTQGVVCVSVPQACQPDGVNNVSIPATALAASTQSVSTTPCADGGSLTRQCAYMAVWMTPASAKCLRATAAAACTHGEQVQRLYLLMYLSAIYSA